MTGDYDHPSLDFLFKTAAILFIWFAASVHGDCTSTSSRHRTMRTGHTHYFHSGGVEDHKLSGSIYRAQTASSSVTCAVLCLQEGSCRAFNYCKVHARCELNSAVIKDDTLQPAIGCVYFDEDAAVVEKPSDVSSACQYSTTSGQPVVVPGDFAVPVRFEVIANSVQGAYLEFFLNDKTNKLYTVYLYSHASQIYKADRSYGSGKGGLNFVNVPATIVIDFVKIEVGLIDQPDSVSTFSHETPLATTSTVSKTLRSYDQTEWYFYKPCENSS